MLVYGSTCMAGLNNCIMPHKSAPHSIDHTTGLWLLPSLSTLLCMRLGGGGREGNEESHLGQSYIYALCMYQ